jgi:hypothetical protein
VTQQLQKSIDFRRFELYEFHLSTTLAWRGWKQHDIPVEVDTARLATCRFKNGFAKCVLLYYPSSEFENTFNAY